MFLLHTWAKKKINPPKPYIIIQYSGLVFHQAFVNLNDRSINNGYYQKNHFILFNVMSKNADVKKEIISTCLEVFRKDGYYNTGIKKLAEACGIKQSLFYYYFKSKEHLLEEILKAVHGYFNRKVFCIAYQEDKPVRERLSEMVEITRDVFLRAEGGCIMANTVLEMVQDQPQFIPVIRAFFDDWIAANAHLLKEKYVETIAIEKAEQAVQDVEGGIMLMRLYSDPKYFFKALDRGLRLLD